MKDIIFKGCATAIVTPFNEKNEIDFDEFKKLIDFQIENKVNAIVVCGTTGEGSTLTIEEKEELIKYCVKVVNKRIPVIAGVGSNNTNTVIRNENFAENVGVDALLIVTPYYNKTTQKGLVEHFRIVAENTSLPIILYNVPSRTAIDIHPDTYFELSKIKNIVATKEASGDISKVVKIRRLCKGNLNVYAGNDDQIVPFLSLGSLGVISVLSNIMPKVTSNLIEKYFNNQVEEASKMQIELTYLIEVLFKEVNPIPIKKALEILGFRVGKPRYPLVECSEKLNQKLIKEINKLKRIM